MSDPNSSIADKKNQWLSQHVDVKYPTKESLAGRLLYLEDAKNKQCKRLSTLSEPLNGYHKEDVYLVDFHRLTVMFALLQSKRWSVERDQELVVEYLTQIIYSQPCELYVGFKDGEPTAAGIVTRVDGQVLISDLATRNQEEAEIHAFAAGLLTKLGIDLSEHSDVYLEF